MRGLGEAGSLDAAVMVRVMLSNGSATGMRYGSRQKQYGGDGSDGNAKIPFHLLRAISAAVFFVVIQHQFFPAHDMKQSVCR